MQYTPTFVLALNRTAGQLGRAWQAAESSWAQLETAIVQGSEAAMNSATTALFQARLAIATLTEKLDVYAVQLGFRATSTRGGAVIQTARNIASNLSKLSESPTVTSVVADSSTGAAYPGISLGNKPSVQPTVIAHALKQALPKESLEDWLVTNCAEFNAVNNALLNGAKIENLTVATIWTRSGGIAAPCQNCSVWIQTLGIKIAK